MPDIASMHPSQTSRRPSRGDRWVLALLHSPAHRVLSGIVLELRYTGRRTGRNYALPVEYVRATNLVIVRPQRPDRATWWRNFRNPAPVTLHLAGRLWRGTARVVEPDDPAWEQAHRRYAAHWWQPWRRRHGPLVVITLHQNGEVQ